MAMFIDVIQMFFCFCYITRALFLKMEIHKTIKKLYLKNCQKKKDDDDDSVQNGDN